MRGRVNARLDAASAERDLAIWEEVRQDRYEEEPTRQEEEKEEAAS
jgi:hypothetical protein